MKSKIQKVKLIVSDLDGTLLQNGAQALEERAMIAIRKEGFFLLRQVGGNILI